MKRPQFEIELNLGCWFVGAGYNHEDRFFAISIGPVLISLDWS